MANPLSPELAVEVQEVRDRHPQWLVQCPTCMQPNPCRIGNMLSIYDRMIEVFDASDKEIARLKKKLAEERAKVQLLGDQLQGSAWDTKALFLEMRRLKVIEKEARKMLKWGEGQALGDWPNETGLREALGMEP